MKGLQSNVAERIRQADVDQDGALSVDELARGGDGEGIAGGV